MKKNLALIFLFQLVFYACSWDNEEDLYPELPVCDSLNVSYQQDLVPIFSNSCYSCHSHINAPDFGVGISLENYEDVVAFSAPIVATVNHEDGYPAMPRAADQLDSCAISKIEAWVNSGTPDN